VNIRGKKIQIIRKRERCQPLYTISGRGKYEHYEKDDCRLQMREGIRGKVGGDSKLREILGMEY